MQHPIEMCCIKLLMVFNDKLHNLDNRIKYVEFYYFEYSINVQIYKIDVSNKYVIII